MSTPNETILLQVDIKANNERLVELTKQLNENKAAQKALTDANKAGRISADELAAGQVRLKQTAADIAQETRILTKANADQDKANKASVGSINQLRAELAKGTAAYNALSAAERDNTEAGQALQAANRALSDRLKELEGAVGDTRRNVGNYKDSLKDAIKESGFLSGVTQKVTEVQETFSKAQGIAKAAIGGNITALGFLRLALIATGLGAAVVVLGSFVAFLTKSQAGIDLVSRKFAFLKGVLNLAIGTAAEFGEKLYKALDNPKQAISDLVDFIEQNLINRVKAIGIIFQALADRDFKKANDGLIQLTIGITNASDKLSDYAKASLAAGKATEALEAETQRILRAERALNVERSQSRARIEELKKLSDDSTKSVAIRTEAAKEAARIENGLLSAQLKLQDDKIKNELAGQKLRKVVTNEDLDALAELRSARADTQQESLTLQTELQNKINSLATEGAATAEAARKKLDDAKLKSIEADIAAADASRANAKKYLDDQLAADQLVLSERERLRTEKQEADAASYGRDLAMLERNLEQRRVALETDKANQLVTQEQYDARLSIIDEGGFGARLVLAKHYNQDVTAAEIERTRAHNANIEKQTAASKKSFADQAQAAQAFGVEVGNIFVDTLSDAGGSLQEFAGKVLILILDTLEKSILAAQVKATAEEIASKGFYGVVTGAAQAALIQAAFEGAKAIIQNGTQKKFHDGGVLAGASHAQGGIPFSIGGRLGFEAEGGEAIMTKGAVSKFAPLLSHLNVLGGGVAFATGGLISGGPSRAVATQDGGFVARQIGAVAPQLDYPTLIKAIADYGNFQITGREIEKTTTRRAFPRAAATLS